MLSVSINFDIAADLTTFQIKDQSVRPCRLVCILHDHYMNLIEGIRCYGEDPINAGEE